MDHKRAVSWRNTRQYIGYMDEGCVVGRGLGPMGIIWIVMGVRTGSERDWGEAPGHVEKTQTTGGVSRGGHMGTRWTAGRGSWALWTQHRLRWASYRVAGRSQDPGGGRGRPYKDPKNLWGPTWPGLYKNDINHGDNIEQRGGGPWRQQGPSGSGHCQIQRGGDLGPIALIETTGHCG